MMKRKTSEYTKVKNAVYTLIKDDYHECFLKLFNKPFMPKGILIESSVISSEVTLIKIGVEEIFKGAIPTSFFSHGLSYEIIKNLIDKGETIFYPKCLGFNMITVNPEVYFKIYITGYVESIHVWGIELDR